MKKEDKTDFRRMAKLLSSSKYHNKETAIKELIRWINNFDRGRK